MSTDNISINSGANGSTNGGVGTEILPARTEILEERGIGTACVASLGGATVQTTVFDNMTLLALLKNTGLNISGTDQVTMNGLVVRDPNSITVQPNAIIVIAGRVNNG